MSNRTQFVSFLIKGAMLIACKADVFAPESTRAFIVGIPNSGNNTVTFVNLVLGVDTFNENWLKTISVSPNPVVLNSVLKFELTSSMKISAEIVNIEGKIVQNIDFSDAFLQNGTININSSNLKSGVYFLVFKADANSKTIQLLIK